MFQQRKKVNTGLFRQGYRTDIAARNKWVYTIHIYVKCRMTMCDKVNIKPSSTHKNLADSAKKHQQHASE